MADVQSLGRTRTPLTVTATVLGEYRTLPVIYASGRNAWLSPQGSQGIRRSTRIVKDQRTPTILGDDFSKN